MGFREKLIEIEEQAGRECTISMKICGSSREIFVENCRKIISCDSDFITLGIFGACVRVSGTPLVLENFGVGGLRISGDIRSVEFLENDYA